MQIKSETALLQLKENVESLDSLINSETYDSVRAKYPELTSLIQTLSSQLDDSINFSKNDKLNDLIQLSKRVIDKPDDALLVSKLIDELQRSEFDVNQDDVRNLKFFKTSATNVGEYATSIYAQLVGISENS